jgi:hypothetical protein
MSGRRAHLLAIVELGGYPNYTELYRRAGFEATFVNSQRKAQAHLKRQLPDVVVAEYNFQSDFRDRSSNLETLMARLQRHPQVRVVVFYQPEHAAKLEQLRTRFPLAAALTFPVSSKELEDALTRIRSSLEPEANGRRAPE